MINLTPTEADYQQLLREMPVAAERLKVIMLSRMVSERDIQIASLKDEDAAEVDASGEKADASDTKE